MSNMAGQISPINETDVQRIITQLGLCEEVSYEILTKVNSIRTPEAPSPERGKNVNSCFSDELHSRLENLRYTLNEVHSLLRQFI